MPRHSDSRERMIEAAGRLLRRQGYAATGWRQVVAEGDAPWGSQSHHFPGGKEQLAAEALVVEGERVRAELAEALAGAHPADMVRAWASFAAAVLEGSEWAEGCPIATTALETAHESDALARACHAAFLSWQREFEAAIRSRGVKPAESKGLATLVVASTEGALLLARAARDATPLLAVAKQLASVLRERVP
jgi:TetR/AcrR family transcriptional regulator, lmrAB and yxaGH operons repressor